MFLIFYVNIQIFHEANVNTPMGAHDIYSSNDFYFALSSLIASNIEVKRWLFKLNFSLNNEGTAYLDVDQ